MNNGLYNGLLNGNHNGLYDGLDNGLHNGLYCELSTDTDAILFMQKANIKDIVKVRAVNYIFKAFKSIGIYDKMIAFYPMIGGSSESHKYNAKNPNLYNLIFNGGWTHSLTGAKANGTTGWADTGINALSVLSQNNCHVSYYSRTASALGIDMGCITPGVVSITLAINLTSRQYGELNDVGADSVTAGNGNGFILSSRTASTVNGVFLRSVKTQSRLIISAAPPNINISLNARNTSTVPAVFSPKECAFASIGYGLTDAQSSLMYQVVQQYQSMLNRQV